MQPSEKKNPWLLVGAAGAVSLIGAGVIAFVADRFHVARPGQFIVRTGLGLGRKISVRKRAMHWPFQHMSLVDMTPSPHNFRTDYESKDGMRFNLPAGFIVAPVDPDVDVVAFKRYCTTFIGMGRGDIGLTIRSVVEGETRRVASALTAEEIYSTMGEFREQAVERVTAALDTFGVRILRADISEMHNYDIEAHAKARERQVKFDLEAVLKENEVRQRVVLSEADLERTRQEARLVVGRATIETDNELECLRHELQTRVVETKQQAMLAEQHLSECGRAQVEAECGRAQAEAEAMRERAAGRADAVRIEAEAELYAKQQEAEGTRARIEAETEGIQRMLGAGDPDMVRFYLTLDKMVPRA